MSGRAIRIRKRKSPIASITEMKVANRMPTSPGVAADSESDGITNCGAGPGDGPTANVNAPRTGCPSAEITRQSTRYQPAGSFFSGTSSVCGEPGSRAGSPAVTWWPFTSVTEMIEKRGSTDSEYVSVTGRRWPVGRDARIRGGVQERRVRAGDRGQHEPEGHEHPDGEADAHAGPRPHARGRRPANMPPTPTSTPTTASTSAT